jgi:hypothetical protein
MNTVHGTILGLAIAMGSLLSSAQETKIPFRQIERDAQLSARLAVPDSEAAINHADGMVGESSSSAGSVFVAPVYKAPRTLSRGFFLLNGIHLGMATLDMAMTQHCIADHHCVEGNPLMPSSMGGQLALNFAFVGYGTYVSYKLKKNESRLWVLSPAIGIVAHTVGAASGFAHF